MEPFTVHTTKLEVPAGDPSQHVDWLARMMMAGVEGSGVISAEIVPPVSEVNEWSLIQRFNSEESLQNWQTSSIRQNLLNELSEKQQRGELTLSESTSESYGTAGSVAVAIVTQVKPGQEAEYYRYEEQYQYAQAKYPGYRGVYLQPPTKATPGMWTTLIRFDSAESLDQWFKSDERKKLLKQSDLVVSSTDYQKVTTSFPGWFPSTDGSGTSSPPNWKTAMLIVLGLYPIVMLELHFLMPSLHGLNPAVASFIGNVISVSLTTWVTMPLAIRAFRKWLFPDATSPKSQDAVGVAILLVIFLVEILVLSGLPHL